MALARCKVVCTERTERPSHWAVPNPERAPWVEAHKKAWEAHNAQKEAGVEDPAVWEYLQELRRNEAPETLGMQGLIVPPEVAGPGFPDGRCNRSFVFSGSFPQKGVEENERFWGATPSFELKMTIENAAVDFEPGRHYYLDFVRINPADQ